MPNNTSKFEKPFNPVQAILDNIVMVLIIFFSGITAVVGFALLTHKPYYTVEASLLFEPKTPELVYNMNERFNHSFEDWMRTQSHEIESYKVLSAAINNYENKGFVWKLEDESLKTSVDRLRGRLSVNQIPNTQLMTVGYGSYNNHGMAELINEITNEYIHHKDNQRKEQDLKKLEHLHAEKEKYNERLEEAYQEMMATSQKYGTALADEKNVYIYLDMFIDLRTRYNKAITARIEADNKLEALEQQRLRLSDLNVYDPKNTQLLMEMEQDIASKMVGLDKQSELYSEYSKLLDEISSSNIQAARRYLLSDINREINSQKMEAQAAYENEIDIKKELKSAQQELMDINDAVLQTSTQRQSIQRIINIYDRINDRIEQIEIELFNPGRVSILTPAQTPEFPDPNKLIKKIVLGLFAVLGMAVGAALLKENNDKRVKRVADIGRVLGFPATGFIMDKSVENIPEENLNMIYKKHPDSFMAELYNQITVRIEKEHLEHGAKTFSFVSLTGGSGVSTVASNLLAMIDANKNEKILVQLNPTDVSEDEDVLEDNTLVEWLARNKSLEQGIVKKIDSYFDVLPLGSLRESDIARIRPSSVKALIERLKDKYEYIFIDGPPMLVSSESHTVAQETDVSVLVIDSQKDIWPELFRAVNILDKLKVTVVSLILNKVKIARAGYIEETIEKHYRHKNIKQRVVGQDSNTPQEKEELVPKLNSDG